MARVRVKARAEHNSAPPRSQFLKPHTQLLMPNLQKPGHERPCGRDSPDQWQCATSGSFQAPLCRCPCCSSHKISLVIQNLLSKDRPLGRAPPNAPLLPSLDGSTRNETLPHVVPATPTAMTLMPPTLAQSCWIRACGGLCSPERLQDAELLLLADVSASNGTRPPPQNHGWREQSQSRISCT